MQMGSNSKNPCFFRFIMKKNLRERKLPIAKKFRRNYGTDLSSSVLLEVPSGTVWHVELIKSDDEIWLGNGWPEFVEYYSLAEGHFLVFSYERSFGFHVHIFDKSASEIDYLYRVTNNGGPQRSIEREIEVEIIEQEVIEILDESSQELKKKARLPNGCPWPQKGGSMKTRSETLERDTQLPPFNPPDNSKHGMEKLDSTRNGSPLHPVNQAEEKGSGRHMKSNGVWGRTASAERLTDEERNDALNRARAAFKSENPFFMVAIQPSFVLLDHLAIPASFVTNYLGQQQKCILYCLDGQTWPVQLCKWGNEKGSNAKMHRGWKKFALDSHLKVGDICVFELMKRTENSLKVAIFRGAPDTTQSFSIGNPIQSRHEQSFGKNPSCLETVGPNPHFRCTSSGKKLITDNLKGSSELWTSTPPTFNHDHKVEQENSMQKPNLHNPTSQITGKGGDESRFGNKHCKNRVITRTKLLTDKEKHDALCRASAAFQSKNPFCMVAMQPSYVNGQHSLMMPLGFARECMVRPNGNAILCALHGRTWPVKFCHCARSVVKIYGGWRAFAQDNSLEVGDVCIFELIDSDKMKFNVVISKVTPDAGNAKKSQS